MILDADGRDFTTVATLPKPVRGKPLLLPGGDHMIGFPLHPNGDRWVRIGS